MTWQADIIEGASNDEETIEDTKPPAAKEKKPGTRTKITLSLFTEKNVTTHISSLILDSITLSCFLTISKQLKRVRDSSKQFYNSLAPSRAPSELLFLTCSRNDLIADRIAKCEASLIA